MAVERDTVTFVCTGNTCRSPMAEALLRATLTKRGQGLEKLKVASFGLYIYTHCCDQRHSMQVQP